MIKIIHLKLINILNKKDSNACSNNPCLNGATCQTNGNSYYCNCPSGYSGSNCQTCNNI